MGRGKKEWSPTSWILSPPPPRCQALSTSPPRTHRFTAHSYIERKHTFSYEVLQSFEIIFYNAATYIGLTMLRFLSLPQLKNTKINKQKQSPNAFRGDWPLENHLLWFTWKKKSVKIHSHTTPPALVKILTRLLGSRLSEEILFVSERERDLISGLLPRPNPRPRDSLMTDRRW